MDQPATDGAGEPGPGVTMRAGEGGFEVYASAGTPAGNLAAAIARLVPTDAALYEAFGGDDYGEMLIVFRSAVIGPGPVQPT
ncbi:MAG: hypothetical protein ACQSGP_25435 [Frankia sp.]